MAASISGIDCHLVQIAPDTRRRVTLEHRTDTINDTVVVTVTNDRLKDCPRFFNVGICAF